MRNFMAQIIPLIEILWRIRLADGVVMAVLWLFAAPLNYMYFIFLLYWLGNFLYIVGSPLMTNRLICFYFDGGLNDTIFNDIPIQNECCKWHLVSKYWVLEVLYYINCDCGVRIFSFIIIAYFHFYSLGSNYYGCLFQITLL